MSNTGPSATPTCCATPLHDGFTTRTIRASQCGQLTHMVAACAKCTWITFGAPAYIEIAKKAHRLWTHSKKNTFVC